MLEDFFYHTYKLVADDFRFVDYLSKRCPVILVNCVITAVIYAVMNSVITAVSIDIHTF